MTTRKTAVWNSGHRLEFHRARSALGVAVVTGCMAPGLKQLIKRNDLEVVSPTQT